MGFSAESIKLLRSLPEEQQARIVGKLSQAERADLVQSIADFDNFTNQKSQPSVKEQATQALGARKAAESQTMEVPGAGNFGEARQAMPNESRSGFGRELLGPLSYLSPITAGVRYLGQKFAPSITPDITLASLGKGALDVNRAPGTIIAAYSPTMADVLASSPVAPGPLGFTPGGIPKRGIGRQAVMEGQRQSDTISERYYTPVAGQMVGGAVSPLSLIPGGVGGNIATKILTGAGAGAIGAALGTPVRDVDQKTPWDVTKEVVGNAKTGALFGGGMATVPPAISKLFGGKPTPRVQVGPDTWLPPDVAAAAEPYLKAGAPAKNLPAEMIRGNLLKDPTRTSTTMDKIRDWGAKPGISNQQRASLPVKAAEVAEGKLKGLQLDVPARVPAKGASTARSWIEPGKPGTRQELGRVFDQDLRQLVADVEAPAKALYKDVVATHGNKQAPAEDMGRITKALKVADASGIVDNSEKIKQLRRGIAREDARKTILTGADSSQGMALEELYNQLDDVEAKISELEDAGKEVPESLLISRRKAAARVNIKEASLGEQTAASDVRKGDREFDLEEMKQLSPNVEGLIKLRSDLNKQLGPIIGRAKRGEPGAPRAEAGLRNAINQIDRTLQKSLGDDFEKLTKANTIYQRDVFPLRSESGLLIDTKADSGGEVLSNLTSILKDPSSRGVEAFKRFDPQMKERAFRTVLDDAILTASETAASNVDPAAPAGAKQTLRTTLAGVDKQLRALKPGIESKIPEVAPQLDEFLAVTKIMQDYAPTSLGRVTEHNTITTNIGHMLHAVVGQLTHTKMGRKFLLNASSRGPGAPRVPLTAAERKMLDEVYARAAFQVAKESPNKKESK